MTLEFSPKKLLLILFFVLIVLYSAFQARFLILGPNIQIDTPLNGSTVESLVNISGHADNIAFISLNDRPIYLDKDGNFNEQLIAPTGLAIITIRGKDRFGREKERKLELVVK